MKKPVPPQPTTRKTITLPDDLWRAVAEFRFAERIGTEAEAVRRLILAGLRAQARQPRERAPEAPG